MSHKLGTAVTISPDQETRELLNKGVGEFLLEAIPCESGAAAIAAVETKAPGAIILDLDMHDEDALDLCSPLLTSLGRENGRLLVLVEASAARGDRVSRAIERGAKDYLFKPFTVEALARKIGGLLDDSELSEIPGSAENSPADARDQINWNIRHDRTTEFGHFSIDGLLGRGGMGTIYSAIDNRNDRRVALKMLSPTYSSNRNLLSRFLKESETIKEIAHPHVIQFYEVDHHEGTYYASMEHIDGGSLKELLELTVRLDEDTALGITTCVASALAALHRRRIIHRDIKPGNILVSGEGHVKLVDFGLAKSSRDPKITRSGIVLGTPRYIAPEQAREGASVDIRADIYSLGITLYQMLTGTSPFIGDDTHEVLMKHLSEKAVPVGDRNSEISPMAGRLVQLMIAKAPEDRFQTPNQLLEGIDLVREGSDPAEAIPADQGPVLRRSDTSKRKADSAQPPPTRKIRTAAAKPASSASADKRARPAKPASKASSGKPASEDGDGDGDGDDPTPGRRKKSSRRRKTG